MKRIVFSPASENDLDAIWDYSADNWGIEQADRYIDLIRDACARLVSGRIRGRPVDVREGYRKQAVGSHLIYFRESEDAVIVIRLLHSRQDVERNL